MNNFRILLENLYKILGMTETIFIQTYWDNNTRILTVRVHLAGELIKIGMDIDTELDWHYFEKKLDKFHPELGDFKIESDKLPPKYRHRLERLVNKIKKNRVQLELGI